MNKYFLRLPLFCLIVAISFLFNAFNVNQSYAFVDSMTYSGTVTINNTGNASTLTDYQIDVTIDTSALIAAGRMQNDCDDIRFVDSDSTTKLSYWLESGCNTSSTKFWVKVPSISGSSDKTIYAHFGNNSASSESSGTNTFIFFDDFSTLNSGTWTRTNTPTASVSDGILTVTAGSVYSNSTLSSQTGTITESRMAWANFTAHAGMQTGDSTATASSNSTNKKVAYIMSPDGGVVASAGSTGYNIVSSTQLKVPGTSSTNWTATANQYYINGIGFDSSKLYYYRDYGYHANNAFNGTWSAPYYVWFGYFNGSNAGSTNGTDVLVDWVRIRKFITPNEVTANNTPTISTNIGVTPSQPLNLVATGGNQKIILTWTAPTTGSGITDYVIESSTDGSNFSVYSDGTSTNTTAIVTGLTNGTTYTFKVYAVNSVGNGSYSSTAQAKPTDAVLHGVLMTGQSQTIGYNGYPALTVTQPYFNLKLNSDYSKFTPLIEDVDVVDDYTGTTESPMSSFANTITSLSIGASYQTAVLNNAVAGYAYSQLKKGTTPYNNGLTYITTGNNLSTTLGRTFTIDAVVNIHGPADRTRASDYEGYLNEWQNDYENDIKAVTGQTGNIPMFIDQSSNFTAYGTATSDLVIAQLAAADNNSDIYMVGPKYQLSYGSDWVHLTNESYRLLGEYYGKAVKNVVVDGETIVALTPAEQVRKDNKITVRFNVPEAPLVFDTTNVLSKTNYGFEFYDDSGSTPSISSVQLLGQDAVRITLASTPTASTQKIRYAYTGTAGAKPGATEAGGARGNLRDSDSVTGPSGGHLYNWSVHFDKSITVDTTAPTQTISVTPANNSVALSWTTNENTTETFKYGLTTSYGTTTTLNAYPRTTSHSISISNLNICSVYYYQITSTDLAGNEKITSSSFTTTGCIGSAQVESAESLSITASAGGSLQLTESDRSLQLTVPAGFAGSNASFQIKRIDKDSAIENTSTPEDYNLAGNLIYDLKALSSNDTSITNFNKNITITINYSDSDILDIDEESLAIYRWDGSTWSQLTNCEVDIDSNNISCETNHFSVFGLFGEEKDETTCNDEIGIRPSWLYAVLPIDSKSIKLQFTEAAEPVEYYSIQYGLASNDYNESKEDIGIKSESRMEYIVKDLAPNSTYYFRIRGNNGCKFGEWSNEMEAVTKPKLSVNTLQFSNSVLKVEETSEPKEGTVNLNEASTKTTDQISDENGYSVKVKVINDENKPIEGAKVTMHSKVQEAVTNSEGIALFNNVEKGDHRVIIAYNGFEGEQALNLTGDVKEFSLEVTVKEQNIFMFPIYLWSMAIAGFIIMVMFILLRNGRK